MQTLVKENSLYWNQLTIDKSQLTNGRFAESITNTKQ